MKRFLFSTAVLLASVFFSSGLWASEPLWIDVRTADEYVSGHVDGAVNIPYEDITARIGEVTEDKEAHIYVYCRSGRRSGVALESLQQAGFTNVVNVGGLEDARAKAAETTPE